MNINVSIVISPNFFDSSIVKFNKLFLDERCQNEVMHLDKWSNFKKPGEKELRKSLNVMQYSSTQEEGTEPPFNNEYWDNKKEGIYVDIISGEPLFSSGDKFESGTGWPSFTKPLKKEHIVTKKETGLFGRTEVRSFHAGSHLGHVFNDGPKPSGLRYCMNSSSLRFIPKEDLLKEGYGNLLKVFGDK